MGKTLHRTCAGKCRSGILTYTTFRQFTHLPSSGDWVSFRLVSKGSAFHRGRSTNTERCFDKMKTQEIIRSVNEMKWAGGLGFNSRQGRQFFSSQHLQTGSAPHSASLPKDNEGFFPWIVKFTTNFHLILVMNEVWNTWFYSRPLKGSYSFVLGTETASYTSDWLLLYP